MSNETRQRNAKTASNLAISAAFFNYKLKSWLLKCVPCRRFILGEVQPLDSLYSLEISSIDEFLKRDYASNKRTFNWIFKCAITRYNHKVLDLLASNGVKVDVLNKDNQTALHLMYYHNLLNEISAFIANCDNDINYTDKFGLSHFHIACIAGNVEFAEGFIRRGIDIDIPCPKARRNECNGFTGLHFAIKYARKEVVELLLKNGADLNVTDSLGRTPIHLACCISKRLPRVMEYIFSRIKDEEKIQKELAEENSELQIVKLLVEYGSDVNAKDPFGRTPLFYIYENDYFKRERSRLEFNFFYSYYLPYMIVGEMRKKQKEKMEFLLRHKPDVLAKNEDGDSILHLVIDEIKLLRYAKSFDDTINTELVENILSVGADVNAKNKNGETPLGIAVSLLGVDVVNVLLKYGADVNQVEFNYRNDKYFYHPPLFPGLEAIENLIEILDSLKIKGLKLSQKDNAAILKFLICYDFDDIAVDLEYNLFHLKISNLLEFGTATAIRNYYENFLKRESFKWDDIVQMHLTMLEAGNVYINKETKEYLKKCIRCKSAVKTKKIDEFLIFVDTMKVTVFENDKSLYDILAMHPYTIYSFIRNADYKRILNSDEFISKFHNYIGIIKGHFTKSLIRQYAVQSSNNYLISLSPVELPDLCCQHIFQYLSNKDLWSLCVAATT